MDDSTRNRWDADAYGAMAGFGSDWRDTWWNQDFLELMAQRWRLTEVSSALDVGCGVGHWGQRLAHFFAPDAALVGVDREAGFLGAAEARAQARGLRARYLEGSAEQLPFADESFELVTCQTVLIHVRDHLVALREMVRVLRPGGLLAVVEPNNHLNTLVELLGEPRPAFEDVLSVLQLAETCRRGRVALGFGDETLGEQLPAVFATLGLESVSVYTNDRCPALFSPYDEAMQLDLAQRLEWIDQGVSAWGTRDDARRVFEAGGGTSEAFERLWDTLRARQRVFATEARAGRYHGARGFVLYLVAGRKPC